MESFNHEVDRILRKAEAEGTLGASSTGNEIMELAKPYYQAGSEQAKVIINKIESLKKQPRVEFPINYRQILEG